MSNKSQFQSKEKIADAQELDALSNYQAVCVCNVFLKLERDRLVKRTKQLHRFDMMGHLKTHFKFVY